MVDTTPGLYILEFVLRFSHCQFRCLKGTISGITMYSSRISTITVQSRARRRIRLRSVQEKRRFIRNSLFKSHDQIMAIRNYIRALEWRYHQIQNKEQRALRYRLRLKISTAEGVLCMYEKYAEEKACELAFEELLESGEINDSEH